MNSGTRHFWIIYRDNDAAWSAPHRAWLAQEARQNGWRVRPQLVLSRQSPRYGVNEVGVLLPGPAHDLYKELHRRKVTVVQFGKVRVGIGKPPNQMRKDIGLREFVRYKGLWLEARRTDTASNVAERAFGRWTLDEPSTLNDPRLLPLHVFAPGDDLGKLETRDGRRRFHQTFGTDDHPSHKGRILWRRAKGSGRHGTEPYIVAGFSLEPGTQWDLQPNAGLKAHIDVWNSIEKKTLDPGRLSHLNVYPDAHIRGGN